MQDTVDCSSLLNLLCARKGLDVVTVEVKLEMDLILLSPYFVAMYREKCDRA